MPPKKDAISNAAKKDYFSVGWLKEDITYCECRLLIAPTSYINENNNVRYLAFPLLEDDKQLLRGFLSYPPPPIPTHLPSYNCVPLNTYAE